VVLESGLWIFMYVEGGKKGKERRRNGETEKRKPMGVVLVE